MTIEARFIDRADRARGCGPWTQQDIDALARSLQLPGEVSAVTAFAPIVDLWRRIVESLLVGVVEVDTGWRLLHANRAAQELLDRDAALSVDAGIVVFRPPCMQARAERWLAETAAAGSPPLVVARADGRSPLLFRRIGAEQGDRRALALVDTGAPPSVRVDDLTAAFGLTPAEARLTAALARGGTVSSIAQAHGVSRATARTHLEAVFAKTGARSQAQLVLIALGCSLPVRLTPPQETRVAVAGPDGQNGPHGAAGRGLPPANGGVGADDSDRRAGCASS